LGIGKNFGDVDPVLVVVDAAAGKLKTGVSIYFLGDFR
jgi:hypothetical protein